MKIFGKLLMLLVIGAGVSVYLSSKSEKKSQFEERRLVQLPIEAIKEVHVYHGSQMTQLKLIGGRWKIPSFNNFPANFDLLNVAIKTMTKLHSDQVLDVEKKAYGLEKPKGKIKLISKDGIESFTVGSREGPGEILYVRKEETGKIFVVHKFWAQLLNGTRLSLLNQGLLDFFQLGDVIKFWKIEGSLKKSTSLVPGALEVLKDLRVSWDRVGSSCSGSGHFFIQGKPENGGSVMSVDVARSRICLEDFQLEGMLNPKTFTQFWKKLSKPGE